MRITRAKEANVRFITRQEKKNETLEYGDIWKMWKIGSRVHRKEYAGFTGVSFK